MKRINPMEEVVKGYCDGSQLIGDNRAAVRDILTDLMHFCEQEGLDFDERLEMAREVRGEEDRDREEDKDEYHPGEKWAEEMNETTHDD